MGECFLVLLLPLSECLEGLHITLSDLASKSCVPCKGTKPMSKEDALSKLQQLPGWILTGDSIRKEFRFKSYRAGLDFAFSIGKIAEEQHHHPDILITWRRVSVILSTHVIKGLSRNDFIMAAKSEEEYKKRGAE